MFDGSSSFVNSVDTAFLVVLAISVFFLVLITFLMVFFVIKYNRKKNKKPKNIHGNVPLEVAWTVIPTLLVLVMFWFGWIGYKEMTDIPENAMPIDVTAQMWQWKFNYQNGVQTDTLYVPLKTPVKVNLKSLDVNHAFFIPAFKVKKDVIPNRNNVAWFEAEETGSYTITCAEYCGLNHSYMYTKLVVLPEAEFNDWLKKKEAEAKAEENKPEEEKGDNAESGKDSVSVKN